MSGLLPCKETAIYKARLWRMTWKSVFRVGGGSGGLSFSSVSSRMGAEKGGSWGAESRRKKIKLADRTSGVAF